MYHLFVADAQCNADFGFVVDVSGSGPSHWDRERSFIKKLVQEIMISPDGGHASVVQFNNDAQLMIKFDDYTSLSGFNTALDGLNHLDGTTRIDRGLEVALDQMFQVPNGMRLNVPHTLVLITDGNQTGENVNYKDFRRRFNERKIRVLVILIGSNNKNDIRHLVNKASELYIAPDFDALIDDSFVKNVMVCGGKR